MTAPDESLKEKFAVSAATAELQRKIEVWSFRYKYVDGRKVVAPEDAQALLALCAKIVENQALQDVRIAALEAEFAPQRPLSGKSPFTPKGSEP